MGGVKERHGPVCAVGITRSVRAYRIATGLVPVYQSSCGGRSEEPPLTARIRRVTPRPRCRRCQRINCGRDAHYWAPPAAAEAHGTFGHETAKADVPNVECGAYRFNSVGFRIVAAIA